MSSPSSSEKKKRKTTKEKLSIVLPNDLLLNCFARVSRLYHPTLSLAFKSFGKVLASPEFYETRTLLGRTETCLYVCLRFPHEPNPRWFTLCCKPKPNYIPCLSGYVLTRIPVLGSPLTKLSKLVACGSNIYNIGDKTASSSVSILDCGSHTWREAPSMLEKRISPVVIVFDGKIYVIGGRTSYEFSNWIEVFDPKTKTWEPPLRPKDGQSSVVIDGKNYMFNGFTFEDASNCNEFRRYTSDSRKGERFCYCEIENVVYSYHDNNDKVQFKWFDTKASLWRNLNGLERMPSIPKYSSVKVAGYCGKMVVFWDEFMYSSGFEDRVFRCGVISLDKRSEREIWGWIQWLDGVLTIPKTYEFVGAFATIV